MKHLHWVHLQAVGLWIGYSVLTKILLGSQVASADLVRAYATTAVFGIAFSVTFLYLFSHERFFKFMREVELKAKKKEEGWIRRLKHAGKVLTTLVIGAFGSPLYIALVMRLFWPRSKYRYVAAPVLTVMGGWLILTVTRGSLGMVLGAITGGK